VHLERKSGVLVDRQTSDSNSALDPQGSTSRNQKDADEPDLLVTESELDAESHMNAECQSITSRIGPSNKQPLSPSRRVSFEVRR
jgi:hypothetical protein